MILCAERETVSCRISWRNLPIVTRKKNLWCLYTHYACHTPSTLLESQPLPASKCSNFWCGIWFHSTKSMVTSMSQVSSVLLFVCLFWSSVICWIALSNNFSSILCLLGVHQFSQLSQQGGVVSWVSPLIKGKTFFGDATWDKTESASFSVELRQFKNSHAAFISSASAKYPRSIRNTIFQNSRVEFHLVFKV